ncbi:UNVERIFIED_CONTAM: hypothetical protein RMT77_002780 [Armadillidium vulgare]
MRKPIEELMATIAEYLDPLSSRNMIMNSMFYQCRRPASLGVPWDVGKRAKKRHSSSFSPFDKSVQKSDVVETSSLPSTPIPFVSSEGRKISFDDIEFFKDDTSSLLSSSESSGYLSASSESSSVGSSPFSSSPSSSYFRLRKISIKSDKIRKTSLNLIPYSTNDVLSRKPETSITTREISNGTKINTNSLNASEVYEITVSSPLTETSLPQSVSNNNTRGESSSSKLTSVSVPSKRSCSESSSNGSMCTDDAIRHRVKDDEGFIRRAACLCVNEDESKVVLISSKNEGGGWLVPGGGLESGEGEAEAAEREAWEEAGITGKVQRCLGIFQSEDEVTHKKKRTAVYVLKVKEEHSVFPEATLGRVREWFSIDTAINHLSRCKPHQIAYLKAL